MQPRRRKRRAGRLPRRLPEPTLAGHVSLTFLVVGLPFAVSLRNNALLLSVCALLATLVASYFLTWLAAGKLEIERRLPSRVASGESFEVRLRVTNRSRWRPAFGIGFRDALQIDEPGEVTCGPTLAMLAPGSTATVVYEKRIHRRGVYNVSHALAATRFPLGVFEHRVLLTAPSRIAVLPPLGRLERTAERQLARPAAERIQLASRKPGADEFHSLREYRPGDNPRLIHWRTSARVMQTVRRVLHDEPGEDLTVLLDSRIARNAEPRHLEAAVSCAATLLVYARKQGRRATVLFEGGRAAHRGTHGGMLRALEMLAGVGAGRHTGSDLVRRAMEDGVRAAILITVGEPAEPAQRIAQASRMRLLVWDAASPGFAEVFRRR
ncbi:MAG: DUF58 domain-containing protein [Planctomycetota bacterium]|jgi:uncharacterized protein (DUF58 family)